MHSYCVINLKDFNAAVNLIDFMANLLLTELNTFLLRKLMMIIIII
jgi:hypothetical protein